MFKQRVHRSAFESYDEPQLMVKKHIEFKS